MDGFVKIPNTVFELGLTPSQFTVLCNLIRVQSYREFKGEVEDGWFAKSQNELYKECGLGSHNRLRRILEGMSKMNIVQIRPTKTVTYFKLSTSKMDIVQNGHTSKMDIDTTSKMDIEGTSKMDNLHNNNSKNKEQDNSINPDMTVDTDTSPNNKAHNIEKEKEQYDVNILPVPESNEQVDDNTQIPIFDEGFRNATLDSWLNEFKPNEGEEAFPTYEQLMCVAFIEKLSFSRSDFKKLYGGGFNSKKEYHPNNKEELLLVISTKMKEIVGKYNFKYRSYCEVYQNMVCSFLNKHYNYFKICVPNG